MCTIIVASQYYPSAKLAVAVNHDTVLDEGHVRFGVWENRSPTALGPICDQTGATWMGLNEYGVFAAITNRLSGYPNKSLRTRGQLVFRALRGRDSDHAISLLLGVQAEDYNPFHIVVADLATTRAVWSDGRALTPVELGTGLHIITERSFDAGDDPRAAGLRGRCEGTKSVVDLAEILATHAEKAFDGPCVHMPTASFGTQASCIFEFHEQRGLGIMYADGPPCETEYEDHSAEINGLVTIPRQR